MQANIGLIIFSIALLAMGLTMLAIGLHCNLVFVRQVRAHYGV